MGCVVLGVVMGVVVVFRRVERAPAVSSRVTQSNRVVFADRVGVIKSALHTAVQYIAKLMTISLVASWVIVTVISR